MKKQVLIVADDLDLRNSIQNQMENEAMETNCADSISAVWSERHRDGPYHTNREKRPRISVDRPIR